eukprot:scaffold68084_cov57-Phaeocystis_antarctica.AAC.1
MRPVSADARRVVGCAALPLAGRAGFAPPRRPRVPGVILGLVVVAGFSIHGKSLSSTTHMLNSHCCGQAERRAWARSARNDFWCRALPPLQNRVAELGRAKAVR